SPEGATLQIPYAGEVSLDPARLALFDARVRGTDPVEFLRAEIIAALRESAAGVPPGAEVEAALEAASRPGLSARLDSVGARLERIVLGEPALAGSGGSSPPAWVARVVPAEWKILVVGLDGADWEILDPMIERGEVPVLARLRREGAWAPLRAQPPLLSPLLWTTVATGRTPDAHGILDFLVRDPVQRVKVPITREFRRVRALWNLFSAAGRSVDVVAWWATWPAEPIRGRMITDRVAYSLFGYEATPADRAGATWPEALLETIDPLVRDPAEVAWNEVRRFVDVEAAEYREAQREAEGDPRRGYRDPVNHLARVLASTRTYADVSRRFLREGQPDLFLLYFQGIDEVCHRFAHYMPPKMNMKGVTEDRFRRFSRAVEEFYRYQDEVLGDVLAEAGPGTVVMVLSDHGFLNGPNRPTDGPADIEGKPAKWHRPYGIWILHGPPCAPAASTGSPWRTSRRRSCTSRGSRSRTTWRAARSSPLCARNSAPRARSFPSRPSRRSRSFPRPARSGPRSTRRWSRGCGRSATSARPTRRPPPDPRRPRVPPPRLPSTRTSRPCTCRSGISTGRPGNWTGPWRSTRSTSRPCRC
ncbi:MAG: alkaline phosphatase family protein, partial [Acidobacteria bacterium]|nr:alkaline phosphatase family protein [Acidobacteriota bacterium]